MSKKLLLLGASGQTGQEVIKQGLERGHHFIALVRDPTKIQLENENLEVVKCNIFDKEELKPLVERSDVVMSCLGFNPTWSEPVPYFREVAMNLSDNMKEFGKRRVIFMHAWYTNQESWSEAGFFVRNFFLRLVIGQVLAGMRQCEELMETTDHLDYTCVLPPGLTNGPVTDKEMLTDDINTYVADPECSMRLSRADVARYMLDIIDDEGSFRKIRAIGTKGVDSFYDVVMDQVDEFKRLFF